MTESAEHFSGLRFSLGLSHHVPKDEISDCRLNPSAAHSTLRKILLSSANGELDEVKISGRSLINSRNKSGPRIDPCGTPEVGVISFDLFTPITTCWVRSDRYDWNHCKMLDLIPKFCNLSNSNLCYRF